MAYIDGASFNLVNTLKESLGLEFAYIEKIASIFTFKLQPIGKELVTIEITDYELQSSDLNVADFLRAKIYG